MTANDSTTTLTRETVTMTVRAVLARVLARPIDEIQPESSLERDLGVDSLMLIHASIAIEEELRIAVGACEAPDAAFTTVAHLIAFVDRRIERGVDAC
jgi:acyl carrier protein